MTHLCAILPFPARQPREPDAFALEQLGEASDQAYAVLSDIECATHNAKKAVPLDRLGGVRNGRALAWCCRLVLTLINLRGNPEADHDLSRAARQWLQVRGGDHG